MKNRYSWYLNATDDEINDIWRTGVLVVDANVLLDLYRYHLRTREALLRNMELFPGQKWIANQACEEFFRNRHKVIIDSGKAFKEAKDGLIEFQTAKNELISNLKNNHIIPNEVQSDLDQSVGAAIDVAFGQIDSAIANHPNFINDDPALSRILALFEGSVGSDFAESEKEGIRQEAERRKLAKIPPGYMDKDKDNDRPHGDYYMWRQMLQYSKDNNKSIIFVTSERKEDWWERFSGKTTGPRPELLKEAYEFTGRRILIYQTDRFLQFASERFGSGVDTEAVEEIRALSISRVESEPAVELLDQTTDENSDTKNKGVITFNLRRPMKNFTGSGHFNPRMIFAPNVNVKLISCPKNVPAFRFTCGTGTNYDFNIHVIPLGYGRALLPIGVYSFEYTAECILPEETESPETEAT